MTKKEKIFILIKFPASNIKLECFILQDSIQAFTPNGPTPK